MEERKTEREKKKVEREKERERDIHIILRACVACGEEKAGVKDRLWCGSRGGRSSRGRRSLSLAADTQSSTGGAITRAPHTQP